MFKRLSFAQNIIVVASALLILAQLATTTANFLTLRSSTMVKLDQTIGQIGGAVSGNIANWLNGKLSIVESVAEASSPISDSERVLKTVQQGVKSGNFKNVFVGVEATGEFILDDLAVKATLPPDFDTRTRPWYQQMKQEMHGSFTTPYIDATTKQLLISAAAPIINDGEFVGAAGGDILLDEIRDIINSVNFMGLGNAFLMTDKGKVLSHSNKNYLDKPYDEMFGGKLELLPILQDVVFEDKKRLVSFIKIQGIASVNWYLGVVLDKQKAFAPIVSARNQSIVFGLLGVIFTVLAMHFLLRVLMKPVVDLTDAIKDISQGEGDLTKRLAVTSDDEIGALSGHFNQFLDTIHQSMLEVNNAALELKESIYQVRTFTGNSMEMSQEQLRRSGNVTAAVGELGNAAKEITSSAREAQSLTGDIKQRAQQGLSALHDNIEAMDQLSDCMVNSSKQMDQLSQETANIDNILEVIKGVSSQTNLLALNAAIEAARAGEAGRGFSVVADEVRQLAQRTQDSTQEITDLIASLKQGADNAVNTMQQSQKSSHTSVEMANHAGQEMASIQSSLADIDNKNNAVVDGTHQQEDLIGNIDNEMNQLNELDHRRADSLQHTIEACDHLQQQFDRLNTLVGQFKV